MEDGERRRHPGGSLRLVRLRRSVQVTGRLLLGMGVLTLAFVAYQLFGTNIPEATSQHSLRHQFARELRAPSTASTSPSTAAVIPPTAAASAQPALGRVIGIISAPAINLDKALVQGVGEPDLQEGPGHYPSTPLPGHPGNVAIAGHRTTYGAPFFRIGELKTGDPVYLTTTQGTFTYRVTRKFVVSPSDVAVLAPTGTNMLTLTTCNPLYSAAQRLIVEAALAGHPIVASTPAQPTASAPVALPGKSAPATSTHLAGGGGAWAPALVWGMAALAAGILTWLLSRRWRRHGRLRGSLGYLAGAPFVLVLLYMFFASLSALLPASI